MNNVKRPLWETITRLSKEELLLTGKEIKVKNILSTKSKSFASTQSKIIGEKKNDPALEKNKDLFFKSKQTKSTVSAIDREKREQKNEEWLKAEGKLAIDVYQQGNTIIINSTIAGVDSKDLDVIINQDMITIRGERRKKEALNPDNYLHQECFWGKFSRSIILPFEVATEQTNASIENGILTVILQKKKEDKTVINIEDKE